VSHSSNGLPGFWSLTSTTMYADAALLRQHNRAARSAPL
jgi:hypothetical protein